MQSFVTSNVFHVNRAPFILWFIPLLIDVINRGATCGVLTKLLLQLCSQIVMDDHQRQDGIPVTHFTLQSIYAQSDDEKLEFEYESGNTNILVFWTLVTLFLYYLMTTYPEGLEVGEGRS